jgi:hypothetical protein
MATSVLRIGIAGCGHAARIHLDRLVALDAVRVVGCADPDEEAARGLAADLPPREGWCPGSSGPGPGTLAASKAGSPITPSAWDGLPVGQDFLLVIHKLMTDARDAAGGRVRPGRGCLRWVGRAGSGGNSNKLWTRQGLR